MKRVSLIRCAVVLLLICPFGRAQDGPPVSAPAQPETKITLTIEQPTKADGTLTLVLTRTDTGPSRHVEEIKFFENDLAIATSLERSHREPRLVAAAEEIARQTFRIAPGEYRYTATATFEHPSNVPGLGALFVEVRSNDVGTSVTSQLPSQPENGIAVGRAKQFDERALTVMLREVETSLVGMSFVNPANLAAAVGNTQGASSTSTSMGVSAMGIASPSSSQTNTSSTTSTAGTSGTDTTTTADGTTTVAKATGPTATTTVGATNTLQQPGLTPASTTTPTPESVFTYAPTFGYSAQDLLSEQTELTYQAMNLRMLLQRALSDRVLLHPVGNGWTRTNLRAQPVLGFQVSVDSPKAYRGAVAEVIVSVSDRRLGRDGAPSLVALLPRDKTYNVATVRKSATALDLGGVVSMLNVGIGFDRSHETVYLVRDADTVALERIPRESSAPPKAVVFAWQFRPVLDQRAVASGSRQVYALLALPAAEQDPWSGLVQIETRWRRYDRKSKTVGDVIPNSTRTQTAYVLNIPPIDTYDTATAPTIDEVSWTESGNDRVVLTMDGRFPPSTRVAIGDLIIDRPDNGLLLRTDRRLIVAIPAATFAIARPMLTDSFGSGAVIRQRSWTEKSGTGIRIKTLSAAPKGVDNTEVTLTLDDREGRPLPCTELTNPHRRLVVTVGRQAFGFSSSPLRFCCLVDATVPGSVNPSPPAAVAASAGGPTPGDPPIAPPCSVSFVAPTRLVEDAGMVRVAIPLREDVDEDTQRVTVKKPGKATATAALLLSASAEGALLGVAGEKLKAPGGESNPAAGVELYLGDKKLTGVVARSDSLLTVNVSNQELSGVKHLVFVTSDGATLLPLPSVEASRVKILRQERIREGETRRTVRIEGINLPAIKTIEYNTESLAFQKDGQDTAVGYLTVTESVLGSAGEKLLKVTATDGTLSTFGLIVDIAPDRRRRDE